MQLHFEVERLQDLVGLLGFWMAFAFRCDDRLGVAD